MSIKPIFTLNLLPFLLLFIFFSYVKVQTCWGPQYAGGVVHPKDAGYNADGSEDAGQEDAG